MKTARMDLAPDSNTIFKGTVVLLFLLGWAFVGLVNPRFAGRLQLYMILTGIILQGVSLLALQMERRLRYLGRGMVVLLLGVGIFSGSLGWSQPEFLTLLFLPVGLAAILLSVRAALAACVLFTLVLSFGAVQDWWETQIIVVPVVSLWGQYALMKALFMPIMGFYTWAMDYYDQARTVLVESREQKMELKQTMEDLLHANEQLSRLNTLTQGLRQAAEDARSAKEQFVANVSHELRTPLNMIIGFSENMIQVPESYGRQIPPPLLSDLAVIHRNAQHLSHLIDDVLDLSQIDTGNMALSKEWVDVHEIVDDAIIAVQPLYQSKDLYLSAEVQSGLPELFCDRTRIREVLLNLLSNAGRFTEKGGVRVHVRELDGKGVLFSVADTGPGITAENVKKLFQPFQQLDGSIRRRFGGTGLGLTISKRFVEQHDGKIWIESQLGEGSTFYFQIPYEPPLIASGANNSSRWMRADWEYLQRTRPSRAPRPVTTPRVIVFDPSGLMKRFLSRYMAHASIADAKSIADVGQIYREVPAHAVILNSNAMCGNLQQMMQTSDIPDGVPIFVCSMVSEQEVWEGQGVFEVLTKPVSREDLLGALTRLHRTIETVLIVDDEPDVLQLFGRFLTSDERGYRVLQARDGREALEVIAEHRPDVILLDLMMPNMNGFQFLEHRENLPELSEIPVILTSARDLFGQPIVSSALTVTRRSGLSITEVLETFAMVSQRLSIGWPKRDSGIPEASGDG